MTLDATPSSYDKRAQAWVFGLCIHTFSLGALVRKGTITGMPVGPQTKARALFQGLLTLAQFVLTPVNVIVQLGSVWEAWTNPKKRKGFLNLIHGFPNELFSRITPLYIHRNQRTPDAPGSEPHLQQRQRDAALAAYERANTIYDPQAEAWQRTLDQDHFHVYQHAAARLEKIFKDPQHYIHEKPVRRAGHTTRQYSAKKLLIQQCRNAWKQGQHQWKPHRSGYQCHTCQVRVHQGLTAEIIEQRLDEACKLLEHEAPEPDLPANRAVGKKTTRASIIAEILTVQNQHPIAADEHAYQETTGYLKCSKCNLSVHKQANEGIFTAFIHSPCIDEAYNKPHDAHATHQLWQKGKGIKCSKCGIQSHLDQADRVILTKSLRKECRGQTQASPTLVQLFSSQHRTSQPSTSHETQPALTPPQLTAPEEGPSPPAPKKLKFTSHSSPEPVQKQGSEEKRRAKSMTQSTWTSSDGSEPARTDRPKRAKNLKL